MSQSIHDREIRIGIDIGCEKHYVAIGLSTGERIKDLSYFTTLKQSISFLDVLRRFELPIIYP